ncbi:MAG: DUF262 domain-containing protein [Janthinobacterium lividum]
MYNMGGSIADALKRIQTNEYVLPAIQREFVWWPEQIEKLFDSLMQGYPFGTFLFWKVHPETSGKFKFFDFVRNYHERDAAHCPDLGALPNQALIAVLDGQQRLTALNIGLRGSMALKLPNKWWNNPEAFPKRTLRLDLLSSPEPDEEGVRYRFKFLDEVQVARDTDAHWFKVSEVLGMSGGPEMLKKLMARGLQDDALMSAYEILDQLHRVVHTHQLINYYEETSQEIERVLNIFIRLNSGGTVLSYSDLLLSIAVAQWKDLDARDEIHKLVDELNGVGSGFALSQDFVLKAGLMLADIASVGFKVENFTAANMQILEKIWASVRSALVRTVELVASFGLNGQSLRADSALLPIAYYLYRRSARQSYVSHSSFAEDRLAVRDWLFRSIVKASGIWGSGLDTLLTALRDVIAQNGEEAFPADALSRTMAQKGKSLSFEEAEIDDLLHLPYGDRRVFPLLSLLFPFVDFHNQFHVDHVYPKSRFSRKKLLKAGVAEDEVEGLERRANELPNLQLLEGAANTEKQAAMPATWLAKHHPGKAASQNYRDNHLLGELGDEIAGFDAFCEARRERLRERLVELLGGPGARRSATG